MRVLITGGTGFIGSRLALACRRREDDTTALGQANTPAEAENARFLADQGVHVVSGSVMDPDAVRHAMAGAEAVFHLAAAQHEMNVPDQHFWDVNVAGTRTVLDAATRAGVNRVVHGSTIGVYGALDGEIDEDSPCCPDNIYGVTKLEGERVALSYRDRLPVVAIRIPEVYGPGDRRLLKLYRALARRRFVMIGDGRNLHHPIFVDDLVEALLTAATHPAAPGNVLLVAGSEPVTTEDMIATMARAVGASPPPFRVPLLPFLVAAVVLETALRPLGVQPPLHRRRMDFFRKSFRLRAERAARILGFVPHTDFRNGASATAEWYREMGYLPTRNGHGARSGRPIASPSPLDDRLTAKIEPFDSFWEAPANIEKGYKSFATFYRHNYLRFLPRDRDARILVVSCGPGYLVNLLRQEGYGNVLGIDSYPDKVAHAKRRGLNCEVARAFGFLDAHRAQFEVIIGEQEINHLTKEEILQFLQLCRGSLTDGGTLIVHAINGAHPIVGSESRWGNFDHYNAWTHYSLHQALEYAGFEDVRVFALNLYVFYRNPLNYVALLWDTALSLLFRFCFTMVGKSNRLFSKKIGAVARKPSQP